MIILRGTEEHRGWCSVEGGFYFCAVIVPFHFPDCIVRLNRGTPNSFGVYRSTGAARPPVPYCFACSRTENNSRSQKVQKKIGSILNLFRLARLDSRATLLWPESLRHSRRGLRR